MCYAHTASNPRDYTFAPMDAKLDWTGTVWRKDDDKEMDIRTCEVNRSREKKQDGKRGKELCPVYVNLLGPPMPPVYIDDCDGVIGRLASQNSLSCVVLVTVGDIRVLLRHTVAA